MNPATAVHHAHRGTIKLVDGSVLKTDAFDGRQHILRVSCPEVVARATPGSFVHLRCGPALPMRRPMSIMRVNRREGWFEMLFKAHGQGTEELARRQVGDSLSVLGPIGQGFRQSDYRRRPLLIGGGVGIPPMVYLAEHMRSQGEVRPLVLMGSEVPFPFTPRPSQIMVDEVPAEVIAAMPLLDDLKIASRLASNSGFAGCYDGFVTDLARVVIERTDEQREDLEIFACGPTPMLVAVQALAAAFSLPCQISLEEYMACAVGGCAGCTVLVNGSEGPAMKRVCVDGPVFEAASVVFAD